MNEARGGRNRETRGVMRREERGDGGTERPYFCGPCLEHVRASARTSVRSRSRQHKRTSRDAFVASCITKAWTYTHTTPYRNTRVSVCSYVARLTVPSHTLASRHSLKHDVEIR